MIDLRLKSIEVIHAYLTEGSAHQLHQPRIPEALMAATALRPRRAASPYARRLARARPHSWKCSTAAGQIAASSRPTSRHTSTPCPAWQPGGPQASALGTTIQLATLLQLLAGFAEADTPFTLEDVVLRAAGCALDDLPESTKLSGSASGAGTAGGTVGVRRYPSRARSAPAGAAAQPVEAGGDQSAGAGDPVTEAHGGVGYPAGDDAAEDPAAAACGWCWRRSPAAGECLLSFDAGW